MARTPTDKVFAALNQSYDAMIEAIEKGNQRGYRVSKTLLRQARRGQREVVALAKKWSEAPTDLLGFYEALLDAQNRAQTRSLELAREWLDELGGTRGEIGDAMRGVIQANRAASEAVADAARGALGRAVARVRGQGTAAEEPVAAASRPSAAGRRPARRATARRPATPRRRAAGTGEGGPASAGGAP